MMGALVITAVALWILDSRKSRADAARFLAWRQNRDESEA
jgi:hypothetical protein